MNTTSDFEGFTFEPPIRHLEGRKTPQSLGELVAHALVVPTGNEVSDETSFSNISTLVETQLLADPQHRLQTLQAVLINRHKVSRSRGGLTIVKAP